jgi:hypothetical protein
MKMTLEMHDAVHRRAKSEAARQGISLSQYVTEAVRKKLLQLSSAEQKARLKQTGKPNRP